MESKSPISIATIEQELLRLQHLPTRDVVRGDVKAFCRLCHSYQERRAELRHQREVDLSPQRGREPAKRLIIERNDVHAIAIIEISLHDGAQRVIIVDVPYRQDDHAGLGPSCVIEPEAHTGRRCRVVPPRDRREGDEAQHCKCLACFAHFRNSGSKLTTTGSTSSVKPSGNGPNRRALDAASTAPCASRSNEKLPERLMNVRSETEPSRCIRNLISALRRAFVFLGLKLS